MTHNTTRLMFGALLCHMGESKEAAGEMVRELPVFLGSLLAYDKNPEEGLALLVKAVLEEIPACLAMRALIEKEQSRSTVN